MIPTIKAKLNQALTMISEASALVDQLEAQTPLPVDNATRHVFGNSIAAGYGVSKSWPSIRSEAKGWPINNLSANGAMTWDFTTQLVATVVQPGFRSIVALGTNESGRWGIANIDLFRKTHRALIGWLATPAANKTLGKTLTGIGPGWADTTVFGVGKACSNQGSYIEAQFSGDTLLIGTLKQINNPGTFDVYVDGVLRESVGCGAAGALSTINGSQYGCAMEIVTGCGAGVHTARFVVTSATSAYSKAYIEWIGTPSPAARVEVYNTPIHNGAPAATIAAWCEAQADDVEMLKLLGMDVRLVDVNAVILGSDLFDGVHPGLQGQGKWAAAEPI